MTWRPVTAASWQATSSWLRPVSRILLTASSPASAARNALSSSRPPVSVSRYVASMTSLEVPMPVARCRISRSDGASAQCTSSSTMSRPLSAAASARNSRTDSNNWNRRSAGASGSTWRDRGPGAITVRSARWASFGSWIAVMSRMSWRNIQYGGQPSSWRARDRAHGIPAAVAPAAASSHSRVLPIPGSPPMSTTPPWPRPAALICAVSTASSGVRPMNAEPDPMKETVRPSSGQTRGRRIRHCRAAGVYRLDPVQ